MTQQPMPPPPKSFPALLLDRFWSRQPSCSTSRSDLDRGQQIGVWLRDCQYEVRFPDEPMFLSAVVLVMACPGAHHFAVLKHARVLFVSQAPISGIGPCPACLADLLSSRSDITVTFAD